VLWVWATFISETEQGVEFTAGLEAGHVVEAAHMLIADEDLGYRVAAGNVHHVLHLVLVVIDANLFEFNALSLQEEVALPVMCGGGSRMKLNHRKWNA
jgi:hypothetical protein